MTDQHLDLSSIAPEALHFADGSEEIRIDVVIADDTSGLWSWLIGSCISVSGVGCIILNAELL